MDLNELKAKIFFYSREKLYQSMLTVCKEGINRFSSDVTFNFYQTLALALNGRYQDSLRDLEALSLENDIKLSVVIAKLYINKNMGTTDKKVFAKLDEEMREYRSNTESSDFYNTAYTLSAFNKYRKALDYIEKALSQGSTNSDYLSLKGWILLYLQQNENIPSETKISFDVSRKKIDVSSINADVSSINTDVSRIKSGVTSKSFEEALQSNARNLDAALGLGFAYLLENNIDDAINATNKTVVRFPGSNLPLLQKMKLQLALKDFEQASETVNRVIDIKDSNLIALKINILILLCRNSNYEEASACITKLVQQMEKYESRNDKLFLELGQLFSRLCSRNLLVLVETYKMVEKALQISPNNPDYLTELAYQNILQNRVKEALKLYKSATKINESSVQALMGLTLCELIENNKSDMAKQQVDFLLELAEDNHPPLLQYMQAKCSNNIDEILKLLNSACVNHLKSLKQFIYGDEYLRLLDPEFLLNVVKELLQYSPQSADVMGKKSLHKPSVILEMALSTLKIITNACPGLKEALLLLAKVEYLRGDLSNATEVLNRILNDIDVTYSEAHILMAQVQIGGEMHERASQSLEAALSHNFKVSSIYLLKTF